MAIATPVPTSPSAVKKVLVLTMLHNDNDNDEDENDNSTNTTVSTSSSSSFCSSSSSLNYKNNKKRSFRSCRLVYFDESRNVLHDNTSWCKEDIMAASANCWYTARDYQQFKDTTYALAKQVYKKEMLLQSKHEHCYKNVLLQAYAQCCLAESDLVMMKSSGCLSTDDATYLQKMVGRAHSRWGLERTCIREIAHDKRWRRAEQVACVLEVQHVASSKHSLAKMELIRLSSEAVTRASRHFARHLAMALQQAELEEQEQQDDSESSE